MRTRATASALLACQAVAQSLASDQSLNLPDLDPLADLTDHLQFFEDSCAYIPDISLKPVQQLGHEVSTCEVEY